LYLKEMNVDAFLDLARRLEDSIESSAVLSK